uniref:hypothetical protein n=1 Tax=Staphylococcus haemolyticus TaxID=1283 RepID=UPI001C92C518
LLAFVRSRIIVGRMERIRVMQLEINGIKGGIISKIGGILGFLVIKIGGIIGKISEIRGGEVKKVKKVGKR